MTLLIGSPGLELHRYVPSTCVVNWHHEKEGVFYIGRGRGGKPTKWGNPYSLERGASERARLVCLMRHAHHVKRTGLFLDAHELRYKKLGCFCAPKRCHGDLLVLLANSSNPRHTLDEAIASMREELIVLVDQDDDPVDPITNALLHPG